MGVRAGYAGVSLRYRPHIPFLHMVTGSSRPAGYAHSPPLLSLTHGSFYQM